MGPAGAGLKRIVSGGQTGADRAAWDFAIEQQLGYGGYVPLGRLDELGRIPERYREAVESESANPAVRTRLNVRDSDGTVVFAHGEPAGGTRLTVDCAHDLSRPLLVIDLAVVAETAAAESVRQWIDRHRIAVLNVAGPRSSEDACIYRETLAVLRRAIGGSV